MKQKNKNHLNLKETGNRIRQERERLNLSRESLAKLIQLSSFYIGQIERGERRMSLETLIGFTNIFNLSADYLLFGSNLHNQDLELENLYTIFKTLDMDYCKSSPSDLQDLLILLSRCSKEQISLIKELVVLILPHIKS